MLYKSISILVTVMVLLVCQGVLKMQCVLFWLFVLQYLYFVKNMQTSVIIVPCKGNSYAYPFRKVKVDE